MPSILHEHELEEPDELALDDVECEDDEHFKITSPEGTEEVYSPDEACDVILDLVEQQFWEWFENHERSRRFKPRVKIYEVWSPC